MADYRIIALSRHRDMLRRGYHSEMVRNCIDADDARERACALFEDDHGLRPGRHEIVSVSGIAAAQADPCRRTRHGRGEA